MEGEFLSTSTCSIDTTCNFLQLQLARDVKSITLTKASFLNNSYLLDVCFSLKDPCFINMKVKLMQSSYWSNKEDHTKMSYETGKTIRLFVAQLSIESQKISIEMR